MVVAMVVDEVVGERAEAVVKVATRVAARCCILAAH